MVLRRGPYTPQGAINRIGGSISSADRAAARFDECSPYSGTGMPSPSFALNFGTTAETRVISVPITSISTSGDGIWTVVTASNHGIPVGETVVTAETGLSVDGEHCVVESVTANTLTFETEVGPPESSSVGELEFEFPRVSAWGVTSQATLSQMPKNTGTGIRFDATDDELVSSDVVLPSTGWTLFVDWTPASLGTRGIIGRTNNAEYVIINGTAGSIAVLANSTTKNFTAPTGFSTGTAGVRRVMAIRYGPLGRYLWINNVASASNDATAGTSITPNRWGRSTTSAVGDNTMAEVRCYTSELTKAQIDAIGAGIANTSGRGSASWPT